MSRVTFLLLNLAVAFYNMGTIWAHEVDIFRSWRLLAPSDFHRVQRAHWRKLPWWVLLPAGLSFVGSLVLIAYRPVHSPPWALWSLLCCQVAAYGLTAAFWGPWQAKLSKDPLGSGSPFLVRILATHWIRTSLITAVAVILFVWTVQCACHA